MKKSSAILIFIFLVFFVFVFENLRGLMSELEKTELETTKHMMKLKAENCVLKYNGEISEIKKCVSNERVTLGRINFKDRIVEDGNGVKYFIFSLTNGKGGWIRFEGRPESPSLISLHRIGGVVSGLTLLLGVLILITGIYLVVIFRKKRSNESEIQVPLLQNYLMKLEDSKKVLKKTLEKQKADVVRSDEINRTIINNIEAAIIFVNKMGRIDIFNDFAQKIFKIKFVSAKNEIIDSVLGNYPEICKFISSVKSGSSIKEIKSLGMIFLVEVTSIKAGGKIILIRDVSERKLRDSLKNQKKSFETLGEMTLFLTHEIRNSLGVIYGYTKTFGEKNTKIDKVNKEIQFLSGMMESFLNFSKPLEVRDKNSVLITELIKKIGLDYNIGIDVGEKSKKVFLNTDKELISSVFSNLIKNAKESGADKIFVTIKKGDANRLTINFSDNGRGIKKELREKIWLPFFTSRDKGTGMGLAIVKKIVHSLNGEIVLVKSGDNGTEFSLSFFADD